MSTTTAIIHNTFSEFAAYRLNFVLWRFRNVLRFLIAYFVWQTVFAAQQSVSGYEKSQMLTYIIVGYIIGSLVMATRTQDLADEINDGRLSNALLRPQRYISWLLSRDAGDKLLNVGFAIIEVSLVLLVLTPPLLIPTAIGTWILFTLGVILSTVLYFLISVCLSMAGFWTNEVWAIRFVFFIFLEFFTGWIVPPDLFPPVVARFLFLTPFPYVFYFPAKLYLEQLTPDQIIHGFVRVILWIALLSLVGITVWKKGLLRYGAEGR